VWMAGLDLVGCGIREIGIILWDARPRQRKTWVRLSAYWLCVLATVFHFHLWAGLAMQLAATATFMWMVSRLRNWSEHVNADLTHRLEGNWCWNYCVAPHNTLYHYEHHKWPSIPYYNLPRSRGFDEETPVISLGEMFRVFCRPRHSGSSPQTQAAPHL
jgi:fatty acid desaturase